MTVMKLEKNNRVAILTMNSGKNRMDLQFSEEMLRIFREVEEDESVRSMIITSDDEKFFSMGVNVDWFSEKMQKNEKEPVRKFLFNMHEVFARILLMPVPVIAAINGHAYGNGSIITCACDFRFMRSDRGYFCFPEVDINIPFLPGMMLWLQRAVPHPLFNDMALTGRRVMADELETHRVITKACAGPQELMEEAVRFAETFDKSRATFGEIKRRMNKNIIEVMKLEDEPILNSLKIILE